MDIFRLALFFPSITFGLMRAEVFPWAALYSLFVTRRLNTRLLFFVSFMFISASIAAWITNFAYLGEQVRSLAAYLNPVLIFFGLLSASQVEISRIIRLIPKILVFLIVLGLLQILGLIFFLEGLFEFLIPRGSADSLANIGRGVSLLATEPSRAGYELLFLYAAWRQLFSSKVSKLPFFDGLFFIYIVTVIQAGVPAFLTLFYFSVVYLRNYLALLVMFMFFLLVITFTDSRAALLIKDSIEVDTISALYDLLINSSGFRLLSIISSYTYGTVNFFGGGVGLWQSSSVQAMELAGFSANELNFFIYHYAGEFSAIRPTSYAANIVLDAGLFGLIFTLFLFVKYFKYLIVIKRQDNNGFIWLFIFTFLFIGTVGNPIPWILLAVIVRNNGFNSEMRSGAQQNKGRVLAW